MSANVNKIHSHLDTIQSRYDPENDLASPRVSWTEYELSLMVRELATTIERLESRIEILEGEFGTFAKSKSKSVTTGYPI